MESAGVKVQRDTLGHPQIKTTAQRQSDEGRMANEGEIDRKSVFGEGPSFIR